MKLLITGAWQNALEHIGEIEALGHEVVFMQWEKDALPCEYDWVEGVVCNGLFLHHPISLFRNLHYIQLTSAGFDRVDMEFIGRHSIDIYNAKGVYSTPMAEYAIAGVLSVYKKLEGFREQQKRHEWKKNREIRELSGKRVVIIGCGDVGQECARKFKAFDCEVIGVNRTVKEMEWFDKVHGLEKLDEELRLADIAIITIALTENTRGLVKANLLRPDAVLVNISRGGTLDLTDSRCHLILDVFESEPLEEKSSLWDDIRCMITPHNSFVSDAIDERLGALIIKNLQ